MKEDASDSSDEKKLNLLIVDDEECVRELLREFCTSLGKPTIILQEHNDRPESVDAGSAVTVEIDKEEIADKVERIMTDESVYAAMARPSNVYGDGFAAQKIAAALRMELELAACSDTLAHAVRPGTQMSVSYNVM